MFDLDGTLVDSGLDFAAIRREINFPEGIGLLEHLATLPPAEQAPAAAVIERHELAGARGARWMPGAEEFIQQLAAAAVPTAILTRNSRAAVAATHAALGLPDIPVIAREDAPPKPDPGGLLQLAGRWGIPATALLYVGDYLFDLQTASNAGAKSALYLSDKNLHYADQADHVFHDFAELATLLPSLS